MKLAVTNTFSKKDTTDFFPIAVITAFVCLLCYWPESFAAPAEGVAELDTVFAWFKKIIAWGFYLIGSGAGLNFGYQLAAVQNFKNAGVSGTAAALCLGLGTKLSATALI